jgi:hypothetical protein
MVSPSWLNLPVLADGSLRNPSFHRSFVAALIAACLVPLFWPGDVSFINDEPLLITSALAANARQSLAAMGLAGTFGFTYGPLPTWMYQVLVLVTRDLIVMVVIHAALIMVTTAGALWWVSKSLRLWPWFALVPLVSPYTWFYARVLWDNTLLIPLTSLAIAGYAAHLSAGPNGSAAGLRVSLIALLLMPLVHLMAVALVLPLALHIVVTQWRSLWRHRISVAAIAVGIAVLAWPYWMYIARNTPPASASAGSEGWFFPLLGGRLFSARQLAYFFDPAPVSGWPLTLASGISWISYGLVWIGIVVGLLLVIGAMRERRWSPRAHLAMVLLGALICQMAIDGLSGKFQHPHYENGTWMVFVLLSWLAIDRLRELPQPLRWVAPATTAVLAGALVLAVSTIATRLHRSGGTRETYGATIDNQQRVARALGAYTADTPIACDVVLIQRYPHAFATLRQLAGAGAASRRVGMVVIRYAYQRPDSGVIMLEERR